MDPAVEPPTTSRPEVATREVKRVVKLTKRKRVGANARVITIDDHDHLPPRTQPPPTLPPRAPPSAAERDALRAHLDRYRAKFAEVSAAGTRKPDMIAYFGTQREYAPAHQPRYGHPPGVSRGQFFNGRGEAAAAGVHLRMLAGIDYDAASLTPEGGAYAVCLSGGYRDDSFGSGARVTYAGQGGRDARGKQVRAQTLTLGNLALSRNVANGRPVRVVRKVGDGVRYRYEGLYRVSSCDAVASADGPAVFRFVLDAVPGESEALRDRPATEPRTNADANDGASPGGVSGGPVDASNGVDRGVVVGGAGGSENAPTPNPNRHLVCADVARGAERFAIPAFNEGVDDVRAVAPADFEYVASFVLSPGAVAVLDSTEYPVPPPPLAAAAGVEAYDAERRLLAIHEHGVVETPDAFAAATVPRPPPGACVRLGAALPLEVFRVPEKGWGLRCRVGIPAGTFVCEYAGEVLVDAVADASGESEYLFSFDHFERMYHRDGDEEIPNERCLCVDATRRGNAGRWINHAPRGTAGENLTIQTVFTPGVEGCRADNQRLYRIAFFAAREIAPREELCYDYGPAYAAEDAFERLRKSIEEGGGTTPAPRRLRRAGAKRTVVEDEAAGWEIAAARGR